MSKVALLLFATLILGCGGSTRAAYGGPLVDVIVTLDNPESSPFPTKETLVPKKIESEADFSASLPLFFSKSPELQELFRGAQVQRHQNMYYITDHETKGLNFVFSFHGEQFLRVYSPR